MTGNMVGSLLLITGSAVALLFGWVAESTVMIWASIAASTIAGMLLALAYSESRSLRRRAGR
jgi:hypothetical protein